MTRLVRPLLIATVCLVPVGLAACGSGDAPAEAGSKINSPEAGKGAVPQEYLDSLIGISEDDAVAKAKADGYGVRVSMRDGTPQALTKDLRPDRVNLTVAKGKVIGAGAG